MQFQKVTGLPKLPVLDTISLRGKRHYILPDKTIVPSVTTMLGYYEEDGIRAWKRKVGFAEAERISQEACDRGEMFHGFIERYLNNEPYDVINMHEDMNDDLSDKLFMFIPYLNKINFIHYQETCLYSKAMRLAGRCDVIGEYDGVLSVIDFKTARKPKEARYIQNYFHQTTAYSLMYKELVGGQIDQLVIMIAADGLDTPQIFIRDTKDYIEPLMEKINEYGAI